jgi:hypothetical protein
MSGRQDGVKVDFSGGMFVLGIFLLIILYWGEPDLHDGILYRLMGPDAVSVPAATD